MCLIASMIASMGSVTGYAAEADGAGQTAVYQTADSASDETEVLDVSTATLSLIHISEPTRRTPISYAVFCLKKKKYGKRADQCQSSKCHPAY